MRLYRVWSEDYEVSENRHSTSVSHVRDATGSYDGSAPPGLGASGPGSKGSGKGKGGKGDGNRSVPPAKKEKKEKTDDQLARAVVQLNLSRLLMFIFWFFKQ